MATEACVTKEAKGLSLFEKYLSVWVILCILAGIVLGKVAPGFAKYLDGLAIYVEEAPVVSIPIAICLFFMMYPIMVKIDFGEVLKAGKNVKPVGLTLFVNWAIKPFTMYAISIFFLGTAFYSFIGPEAMDYVRMPLGLDLAVNEMHGVGKVVMHNGVKMLEVPLWRSYLAGCILLGIAPCTAMVLVWGYLAKGNDGHTLIMVAQFPDHAFSIWTPWGISPGCGTPPCSVAGVGTLDRYLRGASSRRWLYFQKANHSEPRRAVVQGKVP